MGPASRPRNIVKVLFRGLIRGESLTYQFVIKAVPVSPCRTKHGDQKQLFLTPTISGLDPEGIR